MTSTLLLGDCLEVLKNTQDNSIDAVVTDPPYGLSFMGKKWDYDVPSVEIWQECLRVLKPGGYLLAFAGTRTQHRMAVRIEDAGFEIRDMIAWVYGSGFPKSLNIGKAVDKLQGNEREVVGKSNSNGMALKPGVSTYVGGYTNRPEAPDLTKGTSPHEGWGTALKPALEPITVARKPISEKTVAENVLKYGTGGINIDGCRVGTEDNTGRPSGTDPGMWAGKKQMQSETNPQGRFPANLIHDGSDEVVGLFPQTKTGKVASHSDKGMWGSGADTSYNDPGGGGSASRFFYCAKASKSERNRGCEDMPDKAPAYESHRANYATTHGIETPFAGTGRSGKNFKNNHPTVKPIALMEYLVKLVSKEGATVLDPFMGSGSTGIACKNLGRNFIGVERDEEYMKIAEARIKS